MRSLVIVLVASLAACTPYDPNFSKDEPFRCANQSPRCPNGFICDESAAHPAPTCVRKGGSSGSDGGVAKDGAVATSCNPVPDLDLEPNDATGSATGPLPSVARYQVDSVGICSVNDQDLYTLTLAGGDHLVARAEFTHTAGDLTLALLDQSATQLRFSDSSSASQNFESVELTNALPGKYYVKVSGKDPAVRNTYRLVTEVNP